MDQHPVPRNITGFQFHLVGDMTLKQFGELLAGALLAIIAYNLPLPSFIRFPMLIFFGLSGAAFAFLPIQDRPLDRWVIAFLKSIYAPTQFIWKKQNAAPKILQTTLKHEPEKLSPEHAPQMAESRKKLQTYLATLPKKPHDTLDTHEAARLAQMKALFTKTPTPPQPQPSTALNPPPNTQVSKPKIPLADLPPMQEATPTHSPLTPKTLPPDATIPSDHPPAKLTLPSLDDLKSELSATMNLPTTKETPLPVNELPEVEEVKSVSEQIEKVQSELSSTHVSKERFLELERKLIELNTERDRLANELATLKHALLNKPQQKTPTSAQQPLQPAKPVPDPKETKNFTPALSQVPNIIGGVVKDRKGNLLPNIIVTVKDQNEIPQRALKTNRLGQFITSTPLANGNYTLEVEDPQKIYVFDIIEATLTGSVTVPFEILAKSQKDINREKLMKEVFGKQY